MRPTIGKRVQSSSSRLIMTADTLNLGIHWLIDESLSCSLGTEGTTTADIDGAQQGLHCRAWQLTPMNTQFARKTAYVDEVVVSTISPIKRQCPWSGLRIMWLPGSAEGDGDSDDDDDLNVCARLDTERRPPSTSSCDGIGPSTSSVIWQHCEAQQ